MNMHKQCERSELAERARLLPRPLVFTNGVFDLLHRGHVDCLDQARRLGSSLVVGVNSDASARALNKGPGRPLNAADDRAAVLAALECVSLVVVFDEPTPAVLLNQLRPEVYVKGGDYCLDTLAEADLLDQWGGRVAILGYRQGCSTTHLIQRARRSAAEPEEITP
ncbi:adenylyltransferase/cytidyltransferase family protein [Hydrogenophaga sp. A37]|uniref:adenylyltransferase/cytidyltransferase family protein n=1 Tax=Hydrogenophaga sp. A37 TaxID=1945864 RepID=UPI0009862B12|nr:adenylyltransferase/cytidyltransferase family protein [Hydrogenophaga sp. A37]OOG80932.1 ADP-heptose synthase [Hydrogenophaga sp. A37]